ncbi:MAE_28990/MAE_18760 family HEPN-like nuclease [Brevibacillus centrosporus]|uniref:MAE-28990/MAE-18760-like HEPN domain-containing protein n=1 Tax=Brevibacillus centrosporus TaxID=54910 RepID=A0A1I3YCP2_9BACL|nr:MAE_28990/MAE_18760 family HEPN-like nuclease [Brevibacillus centrosporus]SFK29582.1 hypothetical protein SAMN05518846_11166 [Brevibacillus centrosporus]
MSETLPLEKVLKDIERDFEWRQNELFHARELYLTSNSEIHKKIILRSLVMLLYAHFEGFTKFCLQSYIEALKDMNICCHHIRSELIAYSLRQNFKSLMGKGSVQDRKKFVSEFREIFSSSLPLERMEIDTRSNLKSTVLSEIIEELGLELPGGREAFFDKKITGNIDTVTNKRNAVAHGRGVSISSFEKYVELEKDVLFVLNQVVRIVEHNLSAKTYTITDIAQ